jgi:N-acetylneuraminate synthase
VYPLKKIFERKDANSFERPMVIAELSGNHGGSLDNALNLVKEAAKIGVDAIKLQSYTPDSMTLDIDKNEFLISDPKSIWKGQSMYNLYKKSHTPYSWHREIFSLASNLGMIAFSAPFDLEAVDFLEDLKVPCYKIASFENIDHELIKKVASTNKPLIISTGMATLAELEESVSVARNNGCKDLILLKCTSTYPAPPSDINLLTIPHLSELFNCNVGLSDHTLGNGAACASVALGAVVIEKHFTMDNEDSGSDSKFSLNPKNFADLVKDIKDVYSSLGSVKYGPTASEKVSVTRRRSLYFVNDIKKGEIVTRKHIRSIRPGHGLAPKYLYEVLGLQVKKDIELGTPVAWNLFSEK